MRSKMPAMRGLVMRQHEALGQDIRDKLKPDRARLPEKDRARKIDRLFGAGDDLQPRLVDLAASPTDR